MKQNFSAKNNYNYQHTIVYLLNQEKRADLHKPARFS